MQPNKQPTAALIACHIIWRELAMAMPSSPLKITPVFFEQGLHDVPSRLQQKLQEQIDQMDGKYDYILLGYGLCSNGLSGLAVQKSTLVVPRAHDCITLILGSKEKYRQLFSEFPGSYWYNYGWLETGSLPGSDWLMKKRQKFIEDYEDEETADYLIEQEWHWISEYQTIGLIEQPELPLTQEHRTILAKAAQDAASSFNWKINQQSGDLSMFYELLQQNWNDDRFAVVGPGQRLEPSFDESIFKVV